jgi:hypothetical protein
VLTLVEVPLHDAQRGLLRTPLVPTRRCSTSLSAPHFPCAVTSLSMTKTLLPGLPRGMTDQSTYPKMWSTGHHRWVHRASGTIWLMDVWVTLDGSSTGEDIVGIYSSEEAALKAVELVASGEAYTERYVLDEHPRWLHDLIADRQAYERSGEPT